MKSAKSDTRFFQLGRCELITVIEPGSNGELESSSAVEITVIVKGDSRTFTVEGTDGEGSIATFYQELHKYLCTYYTRLKGLVFTRYNMRMANTGKTAADAAFLEMNMAQVDGNGGNHEAKDVSKDVILAHVNCICDHLRYFIGALSY